MLSPLALLLFESVLLLSNCLPHKLLHDCRLRRWQRNLGGLLWLLRTNRRDLDGNVLIADLCD
jgi:hypothetical protein